jgi:hypothetical protein
MLSSYVFISHYCSDCLTSLFSGARLALTLAIGWFSYFAGGRFASERRRVTKDGDVMSCAAVYCAGRYPADVGRGKKGHGGGGITDRRPSQP